MRYISYPRAMALFSLSLLTLMGCQPKDSVDPQENTTAQTTATPKATTTSTQNTIAPEDEALWKQANQLFKVLSAEPDSPQSNPTTPEKVQLGKMLFHDTRLSKSGALSCNSCHSLAAYGVDSRPTSIGHGFQTGERNAPSVYNSSLHFSQFWDGRAADLEAQAGGPILNPVEMAMDDEAKTIERIKSIPEYQQAFDKVFPDGQDSISYQNIARAIAAFERTLLTPAPFDRFLAGDGNALSAEEKAGLKTYMSYGCAACHNGVGVGGTLYQKFGVISPYAHQKDTGRFQVTGQEADKYVFKVPSLRNVARTAPYFHDGKVWSLNEAVKTMAKTQLGKDITPEETAQIVSFLNSLTGTVPEDALRLPQLPPSGDNTPHPEI